MSQTPDEINYEQQRVNYKLVQIDREVVEALKELLDLLKTLASDRTSSLSASKLEQLDFSVLEKVISRADSAAEEVANIIPPGCHGSEQNSESFLRVARSLNLDGPSDWSSRLDDYQLSDWGLASRDSVSYGQSQSDHSNV